MLTTQEKIKESLFLVTFNIVLPSADVYSDIYLITKLFLGINTETFPLSASFHLGPCLISYGLCWLGWYSTDKQKKVLLDCASPQLLPSTGSSQGYPANLDPTK